MRDHEYLDEDFQTKQEVIQGEQSSIDIVGMSWRAVTLIKKKLECSVIIFKT